MKIFCIDESFLKNEGLKFVVHEKPVAMIGGMPLVAKSFKWESLDEFRNDDFIKDTKAMDGSIEIVEIDVESRNSMISMFPKEGVDHVEYTSLLDEADVLMARIFKL